MFACEGTDDTEAQEVIYELYDINGHGKEMPQRLQHIAQKPWEIVYKPQDITQKPQEITLEPKENAIYTIGSRKQTIRSNIDTLLMCYTLYAKGIP